MPAIPKRHDAMSKAAETHNIPHEINDFGVRRGRRRQRFEEFARAKRPMLLTNELRKKKEGIGPELARDILRRQAINYYFSEHPPKSCHARTALGVPGSVSALVPVGV